MANATNATSIPPLLCSTPPPIDFDEDCECFDGSSILPLDDDEFGDFTSSVAPLNDGMDSIILPSPSDHTLMGVFPPLDSNINKFNCQNSQTLEKINDLNSTSISREAKCNDFKEISKESISSVEECQQIDQPLELSSAEKLNTSPIMQRKANEIIGQESVCNEKSTVHNQVENLQYDQTISSKKCLTEFDPTQMVKLEDIDDDSGDEELRSGKKNQNFIDVGSDDFFAIQSNKDENNTNEHKDEILKNDENNDYNLAKDDDDDDDYFQDFSSVQCVDKLPPQPNAVSNDCNYNNETIDNSPIDASNESDDEFGEFSEVTIDPLPTAKLTNQSISNGATLLPRIIPILEIMFPVLSESTNHDVVKEFTNEGNNFLHLDSIDAAKALEYQWINSKVRSTLIRSLGIDSRNILYGEKWNPSMPRFAANLSFDPLKPLKSHSNETTHASEVFTTLNPLQSVQENHHPEFKNDTLPVDLIMDTITAGSSNSLANPLDGSQETFPTTKNEMDDTAYNGESQQDNAFQTNDSRNSECEATTSAYVTAATTGAISTILPADSIGSCFDIAINQIELDSQPEVEMNGDSLAVFSNANEIEVKNNTNADSSTIGLDSINVIGASIDLEHIVVNDDDISEVVTKSTFAGPLKETHIYTPPRNESAISKNTKIAEVDFDYEKAAIGIIIDESVVKKEYRDVVYNPGFVLEDTNKNDIDLTTNNSSPISVEEDKNTKFDQQSLEVDDDFSEFQSVAPPLAASVITHSTVPASNLGSPNHIKMKTLESTRSTTNTPTATEGMILSPAILLPQAISINNKKPQIEWGDSVANINPDELARIDELFSQPKMSNSPQKQTLPHVDISQMGMTKSLTISENVAQREQTIVNDDDWSDFVSVPLASPVNASKPILPVNNNHVNLLSGQQYSNISPQHKQKASVSTLANNQIADGNNANDDEWSDFVSSTPIATHTHKINHLHVVENGPQFNSAAWQNANFYNNPLSCYQQSFINVPKNSPLKTRNNNNFGVQSHNSQINPLSQNQTPQQIRIMHDFSTMTTQNHNINMFRQSPSHANSQFQVGNARIAPSISLIPDLGFAAPCTTARTTFVNSIPKPAFSAKK